VISQFSRDGKWVAPLIPSSSYRGKCNFLRTMALFGFLVHEISFSQYFFFEDVSKIYDNQSDKMLVILVVQLTLTSRTNVYDFLTIWRCKGNVCERTRSACAIIQSVSKSPSRLFDYRY